MNNLLEWLLAGISGGGIIKAIDYFYTAKSKKNTVDVDNFKKVFDEAQEIYREEIDRLKKDKEEQDKATIAYRTQTDEKIETLNKKLEQVQKINTRKIRAINSAYKCPLPATKEECPVLKTLGDYCDEFEKGGNCN